MDQKVTKVTPQPGLFYLSGPNQDVGLTEAMVEAWSHGGHRPVSVAARGRRDRCHRGRGPAQDVRAAGVWSASTGSS